jgi:hypothetical protein
MQSETGADRKRFEPVTPEVDNAFGMESGASSFGRMARRLGAAARASGLVVPAFRTPPRQSGARRTIRRLPGGPVIAVRVKDRPFGEVVADMVDGVIIANGLRGSAATRVRTSLLRVCAEPGAPAPPPNRTDGYGGGQARVA